MFQSKLKVKDIRSALLLGAASAAALGISVPAMAQDQTVETVVVTGSHIPQAEMIAAGPITLLSSQDITTSGVTSIADLLARLPVVSGDITGAATNNAGYGTEQIALRGLGPERTLVLINGRRGTPSGGLTSIGGVASYVDLSSIPIGMIERVDVYQDGASAVYGSDAVAGVVNVVLKTDFNGMEANLTAGTTGHGDGQKLGIDATFGMANDKGHVLVGISYLNTQPISQGARKFSSCAKAEASPGSVICKGSYNAIGGYAFGVDGADYHYFGAPWYSYGLTWHDGPGIGRAWAGPSDTFNYAARSLLVQPSKRVSVTGSGEYELGYGISAFADGYFTSRHSISQLAPDPTGFSPGHSIGGFYIPASNPYNPTGHSLYMYRRPIENGNRVYDTNVQTFRIVGGFKGDFGDMLPSSWRWDVDVLYGVSLTTSGENPLLLMGNANTALDPALCPLDDNCAAAAAAAGQDVMNPFGPDTINQAWVPYITAHLHDVSRNAITMYTANINGDLFDLPGGTAKVAVGFEYRREDGYYSPDYMKTTGQTDETASPTSGGYDSKEGYIELSLPVLSDEPMAKKLEFDLAGRVSHYNTTGTNSTYKIAANYKPIDDIELRGIMSTATRVPSIDDLYSGSSLSYDFATDPCTEWGTQATPGSNRALNCAAAGVPGTFPGANAGQIPTTYTSNPTLQPEVAHTYTVGATLAPSFLDGFVATIDYYYYTINGYIGNLDTSQLLDLCYDGPVGLTSPFCAYNGGRNAIHQIQDNTNPYLNLYNLETDGLDFTAAYSTDAVGPGVLSAKFYATDMMHWKQAPIKGNVTDDAGTTYSGIIYAHWRGLLNVGYDLDDFGASLTERWVGSAKDVLPADSSNVYNKVPNVYYTNIEGHVMFGPWKLTLGIDNLFDKQPPFFDNYNDENTDGGTYDVVGRYYWTRLTMKM